MLVLIGLSLHSLRDRAFACPSALPPAVGKVLYDLVTSHAFTKTLELGFAYGISTLYICQAFHDLGRTGLSHIALDPNQSTQWEGLGTYNIERAGLSHLTSHREVILTLILYPLSLSLS